MKKIKVIVKLFLLFFMFAYISHDYIFAYEAGDTKECNIKCGVSSKHLKKSSCLSYEHGMFHAPFLADIQKEEFDFSAQEQKNFTLKKLSSKNLIASPFNPPKFV